MSFEEEFDSIMRHKADGAQFPVDDANFEKLAGMLDANKTAVVRPLWKKLWLPAAALLVTGSAILLWNKTVPNELASTSTHTPSNNITTLDNQALSNSEKEIAVVAAETSPANLQSESGSNPTEIKPSADQVNSPLANLNVRSSSTSSSADRKINAVKSNDQSSASAADIAVAPVAIAADLNSDKQMPQESPATNANVLGETSANTVIYQGKNAAVKNDQNSVQEFAQMTGIVDAPAQDASSQASAANQQMVEATIAEWLPAKQGLLVNEVDNDIQTATIQILKRYEEDYYNAFGVRYFIAAEGGVHYGLGWNNGQTKDGAGTNYFGGLDLGMYLTKKMTVSAGLQYYNFTNIALPYYTSTKKAYGFGYSNDISTVTTDQLSYLAIPLKFSYSLSQTLSAGVGFNAAYLLSTHTRVDNFRVSDGQSSAVVSQGSKLVYDGTKNYNLMSSVFLKVKLQDRLSGFAELQYGLTDVFKDYTKTKINQRSTGLRFGINILLYEK